MSYQGKQDSKRCPKDVLNANLKDIFVRHFEETFARYIVDVLQKAPLRGFINLSQRCIKVI